MEVVAPVRKAILGVQMLFVAFGALVLVPLLTGLDPSLALLTAGAGTLVFQLITGGKVPIFLASSFAFIAPIQYGVKTFGVAATLGSLICTGIVYVILSTGVRLGGIGTIKKYLPPIVTGPVIMVIGLNLAPVAVRMARSFDGSGCMDPRAMALSSLSLATAIIAVMFGKGLIRMIPILCGIAVGYAAAFFMGVVDFSAFHNAAWFTNPWDAAVRSGAFAVPTFEWAAILFMLPVAIAPSIEHVGDILAISSVTGKDYLKDPGLHRTLLGDGLATSLAALLGGPPNTTYSEVTGAVALTRAFDPAYMRIAAVTAILLAFVGKLGGLLKTIPTPVMGGILILLFGMIAVIGTGALVRGGVDMSRSRNLVIASVILVAGIGDMQVCCGRLTLSGIGLAGVLGVILNLVLPEGSDAAPDQPAPGSS